jgi:hypothetical protein
VDGIFACPGCPFSTKDAAAIYNHYYRNHPDPSPGPAEEEEEEEEEEFPHDVERHEVMTALGFIIHLAFATPICITCRVGARPKHAFNHWFHNHRMPSIKVYTRNGELVTRKLFHSVIDVLGLDPQFPVQAIPACPYLEDPVPAFKCPHCQYVGLHPRSVEKHVTADHPSQRARRGARQKASDMPTCFVQQLFKGREAGEAAYFEVLRPMDPAYYDILPEVERWTAAIDEVIAARKVAIDSELKFQELDPFLRLSDWHLILKGVEDLKSLYAMTLLDDNGEHDDDVEADVDMEDPITEYSALRSFVFAYVDALVDSIASLSELARRLIATYDPTRQ